MHVCKNIIIVISQNFTVQEEGLTNESRLLLHKQVAWLESYRGIATLSACDVGVFSREILCHFF